MPKDEGRGPEQPPKAAAIPEEPKRAPKEPGIKEEPNPEPPIVEPKGPVVKLYGTVEHGDLVTVHGDVGRERRVMPVHRQEFERHADDPAARQMWIAGLLASAPQAEPQMADPWGIAGTVRLP
jgi:hypothetical protein